MASYGAPGIPCFPPPDIPHGRRTGTHIDDFTYGDSVTYTCEKGFPLVGNASIHCTTKDGLNGVWSGHAYCGVTQCPTPEVENGRIVAGDSGKYTYNHRVTFGCSAGHILAGSREIHCQLDGTWDPPPPRCERVPQCSLPPDIANGKHSGIPGQIFTSQMSVTYICNSGYSLIGNASVSCMASGHWSHPPPRCEVTGCASPKVQNGRIARSQMLFKPRDRITFECDSDYILKGNHTIQCQSDGTWNPSVPICVEVVQCQAPPYIQNGTHSHQETAVFTDGMSVNYTCEPGYALIGQATIYCTASGTWSSPTPRCEAMRCHRPPYVQNARYSFQEGTDGISAKYTCEPGYTVVGEATLDCLSSGAWSLPAPRCEASSCGPPTRLSFAELADEYKEKPSFPVGSTVKYVCRPGYAKHPGLKASITCLSSQEWSEVQEFCKRKSCGHPSEPENGRLIVPDDLLFGSTINYTCEQGHRLIGQSYRQCVILGRRVVWSGDIPLCQRIPCFPPPDIPHGRRTGTHIDDFTYGDSVTYTCEKGFPLVGNASIHCTTKDGLNGVWSGHAYCGVTQCPTPEVENGRIVAGDSGKYTYNHRVTFGCSAGHILAGSREIHCQLDGTWDPPPPRCERVPQCSLPPDIANGKHSGIPGQIFTSQMSVTYICNSGYSLIGNASVSCMASGHWSHPPPRCEVTGCASPKVQNGRIARSQMLFKPRDRITFECDSDYILKGNHTIQCQSDGTWNPSVPICVEVVQCQAPPYIQNGTHSHQETAVFTDGMSVNYTCEPGYALIGQATIYCTASGTWSSPTPRCEAMRCHRPPYVQNARYSFQEGTDGISAKYTCEPGYTVVGEATLDCLSSGAWSLPAPRCEASSCGPPTRLSFAELADEYKEKPSFPVGSTVKYVCRPGYAKHPGLKASITCLSSQEWSEVQEFCKRKSCGHPSEPENGRLIVPDDLLFGSTINYTCEQGHRLIGQSYRQCVILGRRVVWSGDIPLCQRIPCFPPPDIPHGRRTGTHIDDFTYGDSVTYTCEKGFPLVGNASIHCTTKDAINGVWSGRAYCGVARCPPPKVENGKIMAGDSGKYTYNHRVTFDCSAGHVLAGSREIDCQVDGTWDPPPPRCERVCISPEIQNGRIARSQAPIKLGDRITFECDHGYILKGNHTIQCQSDSTWNPPVPICVRVVKCQALPYIQNGIHSNQEKAVFTDGMTVNYTCEPGYVLIGQAVIYCTASGTWSSPAPRCEVMQCHNPPYVQNAIYSFQKGTDGISVKYTCEPGYMVVGEATLDCMASGAWSLPAPHCEVGRCGPPTRLSFAELADKYKGSDSFPVGSTVNYVCRPGYAKHPGLKASLTCLRNQEWSEVREFCKRKSCGYPGEPDNGRLIVPEDTLLGSTVNYTCEDGHKLIGQAYRQCVISGRKTEWTGSIPFCQRISCYPPPNIPHGKHSGTHIDSFTYGDSVTYTCEKGYPLVGKASIHCTTKDGINGVWSGHPYCGVAWCPPPEVENGRIVAGDSDTYTYNHRVTFGCSAGHVLAGSKEIHCQVDGTWDPPPPRCKQVPQCSLPPDIANGKHSGIAGQIFTSVTYSCDPGYSLIGKASVSCMASGDWSRPLPHCEAVQCSTPQMIANGKYNSQESEVFTKGMFVKYSCEPGYHLLGEATIYCTESGSWNSSAPTCEVLQCFPPPSLLNGDHNGWSLTKFAIGTYVNYTCNRGYFLRGKTSIHCTISGAWSQPLPQCEAMHCPPPPSIVHGEYVGKNFTYGNSVIYICDEGYSLAGESLVTCILEGSNTANWSEPPKCKVLQCPSPPFLLNGDHNGRSLTKFAIGTYVNYTCNHGYFLRGKTSIHCTISGAWSQPLPQCEVGSCGPPARLNFAELANEYKEKNSFPIGSTVNYVCRPGYAEHLKRSNSITCLRSQEWSKVQEFCKKKSCGYPEEPDNGHLIVPKDLLLGSTVSYTCEEGHRLIGQSYRQCVIFGPKVAWTGNVPFCKRISCNPPPDIPHGKRSSTHIDDFTYGAAVTYTCEKGFSLVGNASIYCTTQDGINGVWSGRAYCRVPQCPLPPDIDNGKHSGIAGQVFVFNTSVTYICDPGYSLIGKASISCMASGDWSHPLPQCKENTVSEIAPARQFSSVSRCFSPPDIDNGRRHGQDLDLFSAGTVVRYSCLTGYILIGKASISCTESGAWSLPLPHCEVMHCPPPPAIVHGTYIGNNFTYGNYIEYICDDGYSLVGEHEVTCILEGSSTANWSEPPSCKAIACILPQISGGKVAEAGTVFQVGDYVTLECEDGYILEGSPYAQCQQDFTWDSPVPVCKPGFYISTLIGIGSLTGVLLLLVICGIIWITVLKSNKAKYSPASRQEISENTDGQV
ncbi:complement receptor type 1 [Hemicordylus capensis]|uniref:complement receptor type 1 n=1 Tax=Hemicordylus capensis TaxID=884348 RepID=UPI0023033429|nr:complement receptor type 1 [Hemicordylus capensis]